MPKQGTCDVCEKEAPLLVPYWPALDLCVPCATERDAEHVKAGHQSLLPTQCEGCGEFVEGAYGTLRMPSGERLCPSCVDQFPNHPKARLLSDFNPQLTWKGHIGVWLLGVAVATTFLVGLISILRFLL